MIILENGDKIQGDATTASEVDYTIHGLNNNVLSNLADGQLPNSIGDLFVADSTDVINTIVLVNTGASHNHVNLYLLPSGGTARRLIAKDLQLEAGYSLHTDCKTCCIIDTNGRVQQQLTGVGSGDMTKAVYDPNDDGKIDYAELVVTLTDILTDTMGETDTLKLDAALSADGKYNGVSIVGTAGTNLAFGQVVYFASADSKWELTDADAEATTKPQIGIIIVAGNEDASVTVMLSGYIREDDWDWATVGAPLFLDTTTAGGLTETAPSGSGDCVRVAGYVVDANTIYFNPSPDWIEMV